MFVRFYFVSFETILGSNNLRTLLNPHNFYTFSGAFLTGNYPSPVSRIVSKQHVLEYVHYFEDIIVFGLLQQKMSH